MKLGRIFLFLLVLGAAGGGVAYFLLQQQAPEPEHLEKAVRLLARDLRTQLIRHQRGLIASLQQQEREAGAAQADAPAIAVVPFVDANFGEEVKVSKDIEQLVSGWLDRKSVV